MYNVLQGDGLLQLTVNRRWCFDFMSMVLCSCGVPVCPGYVCLACTAVRADRKRECGAARVFRRVEAASDDPAGERRVAADPAGASVEAVLPVRSRRRHSSRGGRDVYADVVWLRLHGSGLCLVPLVAVATFGRRNGFELPAPPCEVVVAGVAFEAVQCRK